MRYHQLNAMYCLEISVLVGSGTNVVAEWEHVRGPHGYGEVNEAGKDLLTILSLNEATICNT